MVTITITITITVTATITVTVTRKKYNFRFALAMRMPPSSPKSFPLKSKFVNWPEPEMELPIFSPPNEPKKLLPESMCGKG